MRILLGYTDEGLHPDTAARMAAVPGVEMVDVSADDFAYWRALEERWTGDCDLLVVEQDMVIHDQVIPQLEACPGDWCTFGYPIFNSAQRLIQGLGCTRFSAALQRKVPAAEFAADGALRHITEPGLSGVPWQFLDLVIAERLRVGHGLRPCVHAPDVEHRHDYSGPPALPGARGLRHPGEDTGDPADSPLAVYHREVPVVHKPRQPPAIQVYGAALTPVRSPDDAARLANALSQRYLHPDGSPRDLPAQIDAGRPAALRFATDKVAQGYLPAYLGIAAAVGTSGRVCEAGVWTGESLRMWQALFPGGIVAVVDIDGTALWPHETVKIVAAQDDPGLPAALAGVSPGGWDIIVDDASHRGDLTRRTWELLWPLVVPGGWYVVEDWFVGFGNHPLFPGDHSMLRTAESFLQLLAAPGGEVESVTYRYGMIILRKVR